MPDFLDFEIDVDSATTVADLRGLVAEGWFAIKPFVSVEDYERVMVQLRGFVKALPKSKLRQGRVVFDA